MEIMLLYSHRFVGWASTCLFFLYFIYIKSPCDDVYFYDERSIYLCYSVTICNINDLNIDFYHSITVERVDYFKLCLVFNHFLIILPIQMHHYYEMPSTFITNCECFYEDLS